jgi:hypothetical protein
VYGAKLLPVVATALSLSAMSKAAPAKSPIDARAMPNVSRWIGSSANAPVSRTSWSTLSAIAR